MNKPEELRELSGLGRACDPSKTGVPVTTIFIAKLERGTKDYF